MNNANLEARTKKLEESLVERNSKYNALVNRVAAQASKYLL